MTTTVHTTKITQAYLMNKSKRELADEYLILCDAKDKIQDENARLTECLTLYQANERKAIETLKFYANFYEDGGVKAREALNGKDGGE